MGFYLINTLLTEYNNLDLLESPYSDYSRAWFVSSALGKNKQVEIPFHLEDQSRILQ